MQVRVSGNLAAPIDSIESPPTATARASATFTGLTSTASDPITNYGGALGAIVSVDQSVIAATSAGGGTGVLTITPQLRDPLSGNYQSSTGTIVCTTGVATWMYMYYPGTAVVAGTTVAIGRHDLAFGTQYRFSSVGSSSATTWPFSIGVVPIPTAGTSS